MMHFDKKEYQDYLLDQHKKLKHLLIVNSKKVKPFQIEEFQDDEMYGAHYVVDIESFLSIYLKELKSSIQDSYITNNEIKSFLFQEYRILQLVYNLNKVGPYQREKLNNQELNSQLIISNNIIKSSYELSSYVYLLEWLHNIYEIKVETEDKDLFKKQSFVNSANTGNLNNFHLDYVEVNETNDTVDENEGINYNKLTKILAKNLIRSGKIADAQDLMEYYNINIYPAMLSGGLACHDFSLEIETYQNFDEVLLPSFMKTKELYDNLDAIKIRPNYSEVKKKNVIGNPNWRLWIRNMWENASNDRLNNDLKYIYSCLSGNPNQIVSVCNNDYYEVLYASTNCLLNHNFCEKFMNEEYQNYYPEFLEDTDCSIDNGTSIKNILNDEKCKELVETLYSIKNNTLFHKVNKLFKKNYIFELEYQLILIHMTNDDSKEEKINELLRIIYEISNETKSLPNPIQKYLHSRALFIFQSCIFAMFIEKLDIENIGINFDRSIDNFFEISYSNISNKPLDLVYLGGYCLLFRNLREIMVKYARSIKDEKEFAEFVKELAEHFHDEIELLHTSIALSTDLYNFNNDITNIFHVLKQDLFGKLSQSKDDINKISQIKSLFIGKNVELGICYQYIINLLIKYVKSNKFLEICYILRDNDLSIFFTSNKIFINTSLEKWTEKEISDFIENKPNFTLPEFQKICREIIFFFLLKIINIIVKCYTLFKNVYKEDKDKSISNHQFQNLINDFVENCKDLSNQIKLYNNREDLKKILSCIFEENYVNDIHIIFSRWLFQIIEWCNEIQGISDRHQLKFSYKILNLILNFICYDDERVYNELVEQIYPEFYKFENSLFNIIDIDNQKKVMEIIYKLICSNRQKLSFILDNELLEQIKSEFKEEFPLNYKENY